MQAEKTLFICLNSINKTTFLFDSNFAVRVWLVLVFELRFLHLQGRCTIAWRHNPASFCCRYVSEWVLLSYFLSGAGLRL
jgi:hypothetical protein